MKVARSENKAGPGDRKHKTTKKSDEGLFSKLLGLGGIESVAGNKISETSEINSLADYMPPENIEELNRLIEEIDKAGSEFSDKPVYTNLIKYKLLLQQFMGIIIKSSYEVQQRVGRKSFTEEKVYSIVKKIDLELEHLSENVLNKNIDKIKLVDKLDEIRGLLIDLYK